MRNMGLNFFSIEFSCAERLPDVSALTFKFWWRPVTLRLLRTLSITTVRTWGQSGDTTPSPTSRRDTPAPRPLKTVRNAMFVTLQLLW